MPLRSKSAAIKPVRNKSGTVSYRVTATIRGKQRKGLFLCLEDAQATQTFWELERVQAAAALRPKITRLTQSGLATAEAATEVLRNSGITLLDAATSALANRRPDGAAIPYSRALKEFLAERTPFISSAQAENYRLVGRRLGNSVGPLNLGQISTEKIICWLRSLDVGKKTWNCYRNDLSAIFSWFCAEPRLWLSKNPLAAVPRHKAKALRRGIPERLTANTCQELMDYLEVSRPEWCTYFALAVFAGIRPDMNTGELHKLAQAIGREGHEKYFTNGFLHLTPEITKDARPRQVTIHTNLSAWLPPPNAGVDLPWELAGVPGDSGKVQDPS